MRTGAAPLLKAGLAAGLALALTGCDRMKGFGAKPKAPVSKPAVLGPGGADVRDLVESEFEQVIKTPGKLVVIDYHADWCGPCKMLGPVLEEVAREYPGRVVIGKINVDHAGRLPQREGVSSIPDVRFYRDGKQVDQFMGALRAEEIRRRFAKHAPEKAPEVEAAAPAAPEAGAPAGEPAIRPMKKDWVPPGVEKKAR